MTIHAHAHMSFKDWQKHLKDAKEEGHEHTHVHGSGRRQLEHTHDHTHE